MGNVERATGIEPVYSAWKADVLPLNYARAVLVGVIGFEPTTSASQTQRSNRAELHPAMQGKL